MIEIYKDTIKINNPVILDIGCNNGNESLKLIAAFPDFKYLISVDPIAENIELVNQKIKEKNLEEKWITICACVDIEAGECWINYGRNEELQALSGNILVGEHQECDTKRKSKRVKLEDIYLDPDIIKIDVESHEWILWETLFSSTARIIFLEIHGDSKHNLQEKLDFIRSKGYNIKGYRHTPNSEPTDYIDMMAFNNISGNYCQLTAEK